MEYNVWNNIVKNRFEVVADKKVLGVLDYSFEVGFVLNITNLKIRTEYQGLGLTEKILTNLLEYAKEYGYRVTTVNSDIKDYIMSQNEYRGIFIME